jgi:hypothetical protein
MSGSGRPWSGSRSREVPPGWPVLAACAVLIYLPHVAVAAYFRVVDEAHRLLILADDNLADFGSED